MPTNNPVSGKNLLKNERILASATVEQVRQGIPALWEVTVWGQPPFEYRRVYTLKANTDNMAAREGIDLFVEEMEALRDSDEEDEDDAPDAGT